VPGWDTDLGFWSIFAKNLKLSPKLNFRKEVDRNRNGGALPKALKPGEKRERRKNKGRREAVGWNPRWMRGRKWKVEKIISQKAGMLSEMGAVVDLENRGARPMRTQSRPRSSISAAMSAQTVARTG